MRSGKLRHRVEIQTATETQNGFGEPTPTWTTTSTVWASVEPLSGRELFLAQQVNAEVTHRVTMRHCDVTPKHRIRHCGRAFDINVVRNIEDRSIQLELLCKEAV